MSLKGYESYKDSGVEWLGEVPSHWKILPTKRGFYRRKKLNTVVKCDNRLSLTMNGVLSRSLDDLNGLQPSEFETYQIFEIDDLVFKLIDLQNIKTSRVGLVHERGIMSPAYIRLEPFKNLIFPRYAYWFFTDLYQREVFNKLGAGVRHSLGHRELLTLTFFYPELSEQTAIADYLDRETTKIDTLIAESNKAITLLKERRSSLISAAVTGKIDVTKGLDPDVPMKDSGVTA